MQNQLLPKNFFIWKLSFRQLNFYGLLSPSCQPKVVSECCPPLPIMSYCTPSSRWSLMLRTLYSHAFSVLVSLGAVEPHVDECAGHSGLPLCSSPTSPHSFPLPLPRSPQELQLSSPPRSPLKPRCDVRRRETLLDGCQRV